jgi:hypothetical protein
VAVNRARLLKYQKIASKYEKRMNRNYKLSNRYIGETNVLIKLVLPFIEILGWNPQSREVAFEYRVSKNNRERVDLALFRNAEPKPRLLIEVKRGKLKEHARTVQMPAYLKQARVKFGILTNGRRIMLFNRYRKNPLFDESLQNFVKNRFLIRVISRYNIGKLNSKRVKERM